MSKRAKFEYLKRRWWKSRLPAPFVPRRISGRMLSRRERARRMHPPIPRILRNSYVVPLLRCTFDAAEINQIVEIRRRITAACGVPQELLEWKQ